MTENPYYKQFRELALAIPDFGSQPTAALLKKAGQHWDEGFAAGTELVKQLVEALTKISCIPCLTELLGDTTDEPCGCASCRAKAALEAAREAGVT